jgi:proteasome alpha subunit
MSYSFYDWNNALQQRNEYVEDRLKDGSPVVGVSYAEGVLLLSLRGSQRKIFEVYDRLMMGSLGKQSDIESLRLASIDTAHKEGFERSPDDVSIQRLVGFSLSPAIKRVYNDQSAIPLTLRTIYTELGKTPNDDHFFVIGFDGEFRTQNRFAVAAGTTYAEEQAEDYLSAREAVPATLAEAFSVALTAWGVARTKLSPEKKDDDDFDPLSDTDLKIADDPAVAIREALKNGLRVEAGVLDRATAKEVKFRLLSEKEYHPWLSEV